MNLLQIWRNFATLSAQFKSLAIRVMFYLVLGKNICYWAYFHCSKWPNIGSQLVTLNIFNAYFCVLKMCTTLPTKKMKTKNMPERTKIGRKEPNSYNGHLSYFIFVTEKMKKNKEIRMPSVSTATRPCWRTFRPFSKS